MILPSLTYGLIFQKKYRKEFQILKEKFSEIKEIICWSEDILDIDKILMKKEIE